MPQSGKPWISSVVTIQQLELLIIAVLRPANAFYIVPMTALGCL
jgi:hypothetical protein